MLLLALKMGADAPAAQEKPPDTLQTRLVLSTPVPMATTARVAKSINPKTSSTSSTTSAKQDAAGPKKHYWSADSLEQQPVPVSAPDINWLEGSDLPTANVRVRLYIDTEGEVRRVQIMAENAGEWAPLQRMFERTRFLPGRRANANVASWLEIEVEVLELLRVL